MFKFFTFALLGAAILALGVIPAEKPNNSPAAAFKVPANIPLFLQDVSVTIHAGDSQGSGVLVTRGEENYVLTAAHVVASLRNVRAAIDPKTGGSRILIEFDDAKVVKELYSKDGRSVGRLAMDAEVVRYSPAEHGEDLALLKLRRKVEGSSTHFYNDKTIAVVPVGTDLFHCGSLLGQQGSNSVNTGMVSQTGRVVRGVVYDQSNCGAFPGSSGGGIFRKSDGHYVGMLVRGAGETFNLYVPIRRIKTWAERVGVDFILEEGKCPPSEKELRKIPVEELSGVPNTSSTKCEKNFRFMLQTDQEILRPHRLIFEW